MHRQRLGQSRPDIHLVVFSTSAFAFCVPCLVLTKLCLRSTNRILDLSLLHFILMASLVFLICSVSEPAAHVNSRSPLLRTACQLWPYAVGVRTERPALFSTSSLALRPSSPLMSWTPGTLPGSTREVRTASFPQVPGAQVSASLITKLLDLVKQMVTTLS